MKIRTEEKLLEKLAQERIWRVKELSTLRNACRQAHIDDTERATMRRAFIPMAYAHWEGFVKVSSENLLEYVASRRLSFQELSKPFQSIYLTGKHSKTNSNSSRGALVEILETIDEVSETRVHLQTKGVVQTKSNLRSDVLSELCACLGLASDLYSSKSEFIDKLLADRRNYIAHGEKHNVDEETLENVKDEVVELITTFKNDIENFVAEERYKCVD